MSGNTFVISAPSGTGKTTVCRKLLALDDRLRFSVSHTTREPRAGEVNQVDYHFANEEEFKGLIEEEAFLEWARYAGNLYGTSFAAIRESLEEGFDIMLEIEVQGAKLIRARDYEAVFIFLLPPSMDALEQRLRDRGTDSEDLIRRRLREGNTEIALAPSYNALNIFRIPMRHSVSFVTPFANAQRFSIVGFLRSGVDPKSSEVGQSKEVG